MIRVVSVDVTSEKYYSAVRIVVNSDLVSPCLR